MLLKGYNRRLALAGSLGVLWGLCGIAFALGPPRLQPGREPGELRLPGRLVALSESRRGLEIELNLAESSSHEALPPLPPDLHVNYSDRGLAHPPRLSLGPDSRGPLRLPDGRRLILTPRHVVTFGRDMVTVAPADSHPRLERLRERLHGPGGRGPERRRGADALERDDRREEERTRRLPPPR